MKLSQHKRICLTKALPLVRGLSRITKKHRFGKALMQITLMRWPIFDLGSVKKVHKEEEAAKGTCLSLLSSATDASNAMVKR